MSIQIGIRSPSRTIECGRVVGMLMVGLLAWGLGTSGQAQPSLAPGSTLPSVETSLQRLDGSSVSPRDLLGDKGTVFLFWSNQCPWIDRYEERVRTLVSEAQKRGIRVVRVNANNVDASANEVLNANRERANEREYSAPYVRDPKAAFANALGATRTPQAFVFDQNQTLVYTGAIDDNPSGAEQVDTRYLHNAIEAIQTGTEVPNAQTSAFGCTLKGAN